MSRVAIPNQLRVNDPYQQRLLQFDTTDSRVYLSRASNYLLKSIGNDAVINGLDIISFDITNNIMSITIGPGVLIQDSTLIELTTNTIVTLDISGFDSCGGYLILYTNYQYINTVESNKFLIKLSYISKDGLVISPINDLWDNNRNRIYLNLYRFSESLSEIVYPDFFYISGKKYFRRGKLNFVSSSSTTTIPPYYYYLPHSLNNENIFYQLYDENYSQKYINSLKITNSNTVEISIDEYRDFTGFYQLLLSNPLDSEVFEVLKANLDSDYQYTITHNYGQKYVQVQVFNDAQELIHPRYIKLLDTNTVIIDFSNLREDLAAKYKVLIIKNISIKNITPLNFEPDHVEVTHDLNRLYVNVQVVNDTTDIIQNELDITLYDENKIIINTNTCNLVEDNYTVMFYKNIKLLFNLYSNYYTIPYSIYKTQFNYKDLTDSSLTILHNLNTRYPIVQIFDSNKNIILPDSVKSNSLNSLTLFFNSPLTLLTDNYIVIYSYQQHTFSFGLGFLDLDYKLNLNLNLNDDRLYNPIFQLYNQDDEIILPKEIVKISEGIFDIYLSPGSFLDSFNLTMSDSESCYKYVELFENAILEGSGEIITKTIIHNLDTTYPIVQVYIDNKIVLPYNIQVINSNQILLSFNKSAILGETIIEVIIVSGIHQQPTILNHYDNSYVIEFGTSILIDSKLTVTHNLDYLYPVVQVYDNDNKVVIPYDIQAINNNQVVIDFTSSYTIDNFFKAVIMRSS